LPPDAIPDVEARMFVLRTAWFRFRRENGTVQKEKWSEIPGAIIP
jgi:hypothetical protein